MALQVREGSLNNFVTDLCAFVFLGLFLWWFMVFFFLVLLFVFSRGNFLSFPLSEQKESLCKVRENLKLSVEQVLLLDETKTKKYITVLTQ